MKARIVWPLVATLALLPVWADAGGFDLKTGQLTHDGSWSTQVVAVTNRSGLAVQLITVECGFLRNDTLLAAGIGISQNVAPDQTAYIEVPGENAGTANRADCRVNSVE